MATLRREASGGGGRSAHLQQRPGTRRRLDSGAPEEGGPIGCGSGVGDVGSESAALDPADPGQRRTCTEAPWARVE